MERTERASPERDGGQSAKMWRSKTWRPRACGSPDFPPSWALTDLPTRGSTSRQSILNLKALNRERGAAEDERAAQYSYKDARDLVVLATGNAYLQALSGARPGGNRRSANAKRAGAV